MLPPAEAIKTFIIMSKVLLSWGVPKEDIHSSQCYLYELSQAIVYYSKTPREQVKFLTISAQESKFSYSSTEKPLTNTGSGACGPYQIVPKWSVPKDLPATCEELHDPYDATWRVKEVLSYIGMLKKPKDVMCYYATGNMECTHEKTPYSRKHSRIEQKVWRYFKELKKYDAFTLATMQNHLNTECGPPNSAKPMSDEPMR